MCYTVLLMQSAFKLHKDALYLTALTAGKGENPSEREEQLPKYLHCMVALRRGALTAFIRNQAAQLHPQHPLAGPGLPLPPAAACPPALRCRSS